MLKARQIQRGLLAVAASIAMAVPLMSMSQSAHAQAGGGIAYLELDNISFTWGSDGATVNIADIIVSAGSANTGDTGASFDSGATDSDTDSALISAGGAVDPLRACVGACGSAPAENSQTVTTGLVATTYASADGFVVGSTIDLPGVTAGATAVARADTQLSKTEGSTANANVATLTTFTFAVGAARIGDTLVFNYDYVQELYAEIDPTLASPTSFVQVGVSWTINVDDSGGTSFLSASPAVLQGTLGADGDLNPGPNTKSISGAGLSETSAALPLGIYTLTIRHNANLDAEVRLVPEPTALALLAFGLVAVAGVSRRRRKNGALSA